MPPSREFAVTIDQAVLEAVREELDIGSVRIVVLNRPSGSILGTWHSGNRLVTLETAQSCYQFERLLHVKQEIVETLLHELRHAYQDDHWTWEKRAKDRKLPYHLQEAEADANKWAKGHTTKWMSLIDIRAKGTRSVLSRLTAAERTSR